MTKKTETPAKLLSESEIQNIRERAESYYASMINQADSKGALSTDCLALLADREELVRQNAIAIKALEYGVQECKGAHGYWPATRVEKANEDALSRIRSPRP